MPVGKERDELKDFRMDGRMGKMERKAYRAAGYVEKERRT